MFGRNTARSLSKKIYIYYYVVSRESATTVVLAATSFFTCTIAFFVREEKIGIPVCLFYYDMVLARLPYLSPTLCDAYCWYFVLLVIPKSST